MPLAIYPFNETSTSSSWALGKAECNTLRSLNCLFNRLQKRHDASSLTLLGIHRIVQGQTNKTAQAIMGDFALSAEWIKRNSRSFTNAVQVTLGQMCREHRHFVSYIEFLQTELQDPTSSINVEYKEALAAVKVSEAKKIQDSNSYPVGVFGLVPALT